MIPSNMLKYAKEFINQLEERDKAYEEQDHDKAFDIELDQRENGAAIASWIIEQAEKQTEPPVKCPHCEGTDIVSDGNPEHGSDCLWQKMECENCGKSWNEVYEFAFLEKK